MFKRPHNYIASAALLTVAIVSAVIAGPPPASLGLGLALGFFIIIGSLVGHGLAEEDAPPDLRLYLGFLATLAALVFQGAVIYRLVGLNAAWTAALLALVAAEAVAFSVWKGRPSPFRRLAALLTGRKTQGPAPVRRSLSEGGAFLFLAFVAAALLLGYFWRLDAFATDAALRTPWDAVPGRVLGVVFLAAFALALAVLSPVSSPLVIAPIAALGLFAVGVAARTYLVGFGFDPFIHQATEQTIMDAGAVTPKPFYYLGQYALVTALARLTGAGVRTLDTWLVPALFTAVLPLYAWLGKRVTKLPWSHAAAGALALLLLPLATFISTTPQGVADTLLLATAAATMLALAGALPSWFAALLALAAAATHPLAGLPALALAALAVLVPLAAKRPRLRRWLPLVPVGLLAAVPAMFFVNAALSGADVTWNAALLADPAALWSSLFPAAPPMRLFDPLLDFAYSWNAVRGLAVLALAACGYRALRRQKIDARPLVAVAAACAGSYVLMKGFVSFNFLINYERGSYADRLAVAAVIVLAPLAAAGLASLAATLARRGLGVKLAAAFLLAAVLTSTVYLAYPRRDRHDSSRGWSASGADVRAVRSIEADAGGRTYVVLANQSVGAAAMRELGFAGRYLKAPPTGEEIYLYPIPTSSPLYDKFLTMNEQRGSRTVADLTMRWLGVDRLYYIVDFYWNNAGQIVPAAKLQADQSWTVDNQAFVFRYDRR